MCRLLHRKAGVGKKSREKWINKASAQILVLRGVLYTKLVTYLLSTVKTFEHTYRHKQL